MAHYQALIHKESGSCYGVSFPDLPGCVAAGDTLDEAVRNAVEALRLHVENLEAHGDPVPAPRALEDLQADRQVEAEGASWVSVPLLLEAGAPARVNISISKRLLEAIDTEAKARGLTRSGFLAEAAQEVISRR